MKLANFLRLKLKTKYGNAIHVFASGTDKTLCGKPQENYDTEEGTVTVNEFRKWGNSCCKRCLKVFEDREAAYFKP